MSTGGTSPSPERCVERLRLDAAKAGATAIPSIKNKRRGSVYRVFLVIEKPRRLFCGYCQIKNCDCTDTVTTIFRERTYPNIHAKNETVTIRVLVIAQVLSALHAL